MWKDGSPGLGAALTAQIQLNLEWMLLAGSFVGLVLLGLFVIACVKRWHRAQQAPTPPTRLEDFRALMEQGLLDPLEFERIRERFENRPPPRGPSPPPVK
jgi:hypothetical protein